MHHTKKICNAYEGSFEFPFIFSHFSLPHSFRCNMKIMRTHATHTHSRTYAHSLNSNNSYAHAHTHTYTSGAQSWKAWNQHSFCQVPRCVWSRKQTYRLHAFHPHPAASAGFRECEWPWWRVTPSQCVPCRFNASSSRRVDSIDEQSHSASCVCECVDVLLFACMNV